MHVDSQGVHVGKPFLRGPPCLWRQLLPSAPDQRVFSPTGVLLTPQGMPVSPSFGCLPEALGSNVGMNIDAALSTLLVGSVR
jgi:hypothetical protein